MGSTLDYSESTYGSFVGHSLWMSSDGNDDGAGFGGS